MLALFVCIAIANNNSNQTLAAYKDVLVKLLTTYIVTYISAWLCIANYIYLYVALYSYLLDDSKNFQF